MPQLNAHRIYEELHPDLALAEGYQASEFESYIRSGVEPTFRALEHRAIEKKTVETDQVRFYEAVLGAAARYAENPNGYMKAEGAQLAGLVANRKFEMWKTAQEIVDRAITDIHERAFISHKTAENNQRQNIEQTRHWTIAYVSGNSVMWDVPTPMIDQAKDRITKSMGELAKLNEAAFPSIVLKLSDGAPVNSPMQDNAILAFCEVARSLHPFVAMKAAIAVASESDGKPALLPLTSAAAYVLDSAHHFMAASSDPDNRIMAANLLNSVRNNTAVPDFVRQFAKQRLMEDASRPGFSASLHISMRNKLN